MLLSSTVHWGAVAELSAKENMSDFKILSLSELKR